MEDHHGHHQSETHFGYRIPQHGAWFLGRAQEGNHHLLGQAYPTANGHEGGGPP